MTAGQKKKKPPRIAEWLMIRLSWFEDREAILENLREEYEDRLQSKGKLLARWWYRLHVLRSFMPFMGFELRWRFSMLKNYFRIAVRSFMKNKVFSAINIAGLAVGMTCFILISLFVGYEVSYDRYHQHADRIYRIIVDTHEFYKGKDQVSVTTSWLAGALKEEFPEIANAATIRKEGITIRHNEQLLSDVIFFADPEFFEIFTFPLIQGDQATAMQEPYSLLLTPESAKKYFGEQEPLGQTLSINDRLYHVTGILDDVPKNSHFHFDLVSPFATWVDIRGEDRVYRNNSWSYYTYVQLTEAADPVPLEPKLTTLLRRHRDNSTQTLRLQALKDIHFYGRTNFDLESNRDIRTIYLFSAIALFILLIACFNYINLSTARLSRRAKEVGMRKVIGATRQSLIRQFLAESCLFTLVALFLSIGLVWLLLPSFSALVNSTLSLSLITKRGTLLLYFVIVLFVGLGSGFYPALILSSFRPASILKGEYRRTDRGSLFFRNSLVSLQFIASIALIFCSFVVYKQLLFIKNKDLGIVTDYTMILYSYDDHEVLRREFESHPGILDITSSSESPVNVRSANAYAWEGMPEEENLIVYNLFVDHDFFDYYGIKLIAGSHFSRERTTDRRAYIVNEAAVKYIGWERPVGKRFGHDKENLGTIVGVVEDFHFAPLNLKIEPLAIALIPEGNRFRFSLRLDPSDIPGTIKFVETAWKKFNPDRVFRYVFLDETLDRMYRSERRLGTMFFCFMILAILIAGLGLFGIASFTAEQRTKEIGIRKVVGASVFGISFLLVRHLLSLIVISSLVACPIGWFIMQKWLQNFAYKTEIGPFVFMGAAGITLCIALGAVAYQSLKAAMANPVDSLRYE